MLLSRASTGLIWQPVSRTEQVDGGQRLRLGHRDGQRVADLEQRQHPQARGLFAVDQARRGRIDQAVPQVAALHFELLGQGAEHGFGRKDAQIDQHFAQTLVVLVLGFQGAQQVSLADEALLQQKLAEFVGAHQSHVFSPAWPARRCAGKGRPRVVHV